MLLIIRGITVLNSKIFRTAASVKILNAAQALIILCSMYTCLVETGAFPVSLQRCQSGDALFPPLAVSLVIIVVYSRTGKAVGNGTEVIAFNNLFRYIQTGISQTGK